MHIIYKKHKGEIIMNTLLIYFALPVATIILAIVLEKILRNPALTAATFFAIYLIVAFGVFDTSFLVYAIVYTILAYIAAAIAEFFYQDCIRRCRGGSNCDDEGERNSVNSGNIITLRNRDIERIANQLAEIQNDGTNNTIRVSNRERARIASQLAEIQNNESNNDCGCNYDTSDIPAANVLNNTTGGRTNWHRYRR